MTESHDWKSPEDKLGRQEIVKEISGPKVDELRELYIMREDLEESINAMRLYFERYADIPPGTDDFTIRRSLFRDAVVQFCSCFSTKDPRKLKPAEVYAGHENWEPMAQWFLDTRNAYAAHSFGPQRMHEVGAILELNEDTVRYVRIGDFANSYGGLQKAWMEPVLVYMALALRFVRQRIDQIHDALDAELKSTPPIQMLAYPDLVFTMPNPEDIPIPRHQFRKKAGRVKVPVREGLRAGKFEPVSNPDFRISRARPHPEGEPPPSDAEPER